MARRRKARKKDDDPLGPYRRLRRKMPPPERVIPDKRAKLEEERAERQIEERD